MGEPILDPGRQAGMCAHNGTEWHKVAGDANGHLQVDIISLPSVKAGVRRLATNVAVYNGVPGDTLWHNLLSVSGPGVLIGLDFVANHYYSGVRIQIDGSYIYCPAAHVPEIHYMVSIYNLQQSGGESSWYKIGAYDTTNNQFSLFLKREIFYYNSLIVDYRAGVSTTDVGVAAHYQAVE